MTQQQQQWNQPSEEEAQVPLGAGGDAAAESPPASDRKPKVSGPTLVLFGAFASALVIIYLVGMQNKPRAASAAQANSDPMRNSAITELLQKKGKAEELQGLFSDTRKLVKLFYSVGNQHAAVPHLSHDPFGEDDAPVVVRTANMQTPVVVNSQNSAELEELRKCAEEFKTLKLQSVMSGNVSVAVINNRMVQVGNTIGEFTVKAIEPTRVLLSHGKNIFELKAAVMDADK